MATFIQTVEAGGEPMNVVATLPPSQVILGFAQLLQGCNPASVPFHEWPEPWKSAGVRVAGANGRRQEVLRECLLQQCGSHTEEVVRSIFAIDLTAPADHFSGWEPPVPFHQNALPLFPTDTLPQWLRQFVEAEAEATQTPPDMAAMMALSVLSLALAKKLIVRPKPGWIEPVNVWTITTMEPANRKSAVVRDLMEPVVTFLRNETQQLAPAIREAEARRKILDGRCEYTIGRASKARNDEAEQLTAEAVQLTNEIAEVHVPASPKLWTDDCTPEMMGSLLAEHDGRMAIISAEGNIIELMAGRYSKGKPNLGIPGRSCRRRLHG